MKHRIFTLQALVEPPPHPRLTKKGPKKQNEESHAELNELSILIIHAIDDARLVIGHVRKLMSSSFSKETGLHKWFDDIENALNYVLKAIRLEGYRRPWNSTDNEEMDTLVDVLDNAWSQSRLSSQILNKMEGEVGDLLLNLIEYWVDEIKTRGYVVHGLLEGSEDLYVVKTAFNCIPIINYPPKYGSET